MNQQIRVGICLLGESRRLAVVAIACSGAAMLLRPLGPLYTHRFEEDIFI